MRNKLRFSADITYKESAIVQYHEDLGYSFSVSIT